MNDQHPHADYPSHGAYPTGSHETGGYEAGTYGTGTYDTGAYATGTYDSGTYGTGVYDTGSYAASYDSASHGGYDAGHSGSYDTGQYDTGGWTAAASATTQAHWDAGAYTGQWDASAWNQAHEAQQADAAQQFASTAVYETTGQWYTGGLDTGSYDATAWADASAAAGAADTSGLTEGPAEHTPETFVPEQYDYATADEAGLADAAPLGHPAGHRAASPGGQLTDDRPHEADSPETHGADFGADYAGYPDSHPYDSYESHDGYEGHEGYGEGTDRSDAGTDETGPEPVVTAASAAAAAARPGRRPVAAAARRRPAAKRSAPAHRGRALGLRDGRRRYRRRVRERPHRHGRQGGGGIGGRGRAPVKPAVANQALDTQLAALDTGARDFGNRASRTQERIDLKERQEAERKRKAEERRAARGHASQFALPVELHQLSARYGQAGVNWMSLHTGIDFPSSTARRSWRPRTAPCARSGTARTGTW